jgi:uncharacterized protein
MEKQEKYALVTGASSGIGREMARLLAVRGYDLVLVSRNEAALTEFSGELAAKYGTEVIVIPADLGAPGAAARLYEECTQCNIGIEVLVNNAGLGHYGEVAVMPADRVEHLLTLNVTSLTVLCRLFGADMCERKRGWILNVSSIVAAGCYPYFAVYASSKRYVTAFSKALREEMKPCGVMVSCLHPGQTRTNFFNAAGGRKVSDAMLMNPADVAAAGLDGLFRGRSQVTPGVLNRLMTMVLPVVPARYVGRVMRSMIGNK